MSIFGDIAAAIFGTDEANAAEAQPASAGSPATAAPAAKSAGPAAQAAGSAAPAATDGKSNVDVAALLDKMKKESKQDLNWRKSIVDLMKLLKLDSSVKARKALADELKYPGDKNDSAAMNIWLHKQVMTKLAANGGIVPKELQD
jgi:hypothetical protein